MRWVVEPEPAAYAERVMPWLERDPAVRSVPATITLAVLDGTYDAPWLAWLEDGGEVAGVAVRTPPRGVVVTDLPAGAAAALAGVADPGLPGAGGPAAEAAAFVTAYADRHGARARCGHRSRLFRLTEVTPPPPPPGRLRVAAGADVEQAAAWFAAFAREAGMDGGPDVPLVRRRVGHGRLLLWEVAGTPVALVGHTEPVAGVPRIAPVYTPPEHRRRGYAGAATAGVCQRLLAAGAVAVVLVADRANPTATGIYRRIGFEPVADWDDWVLEY
jgi:GNAT superfamily N-acetyltransferase